MSKHRKRSVARRCRSQRRLSFEPLETRCLLSTFTVNSVDDARDGDPTDGVCDTGSVTHGLTGICTLRAAIEQANATPAADTVEFDLLSEADRSRPGPHVPRITVPRELPHVKEGMHINGATQGATRVELVPAGPNEFVGLTIDGSGGTFHALVVSGFTNGIVINGNANQITGSFIGTDATGTGTTSYHFVSGGTYTGNQLSGILLLGQNNVIGGKSAQDRNVISGNSRYGVSGNGGNVIEMNYIGTDVAGLAAVPNMNDGIWLSGPNNKVLNNLISGNGIPAGQSFPQTWANGITIHGNGSLVQGNLIGVDASGQKALPNTNIGILASDGVQIGGVEPGARNIISGNAIHGILLEGDTLVQGNYIGVDDVASIAIPNGTSSIADSGDGIRVRGGNNVIGGTSKEASNIISGNIANGIHLTGAYATGNTIKGNWLGTNDANFELGNRFAGINVEVPDVMIGGDEEGAGNIVAFNRGPGILVANNPNNQIRKNSIYNNGGVGIDLVQGRFGSYGRTPNDENDADEAGGNRFQNWPVIETIVVNNDEVNVRFSVDTAVANATYPLQIDFYRADPFDLEEGYEYLCTATYPAASAQQSITATFHLNEDNLQLRRGDVIVATATDAAGNTSEFSYPPTAVDVTSDLIVNSSGDESDVPGDNVCDVDLEKPGSQCTLRAAIEIANAQPGRDTISFALDGLEEELVIRPTRPLPDITDPVVIDGTSQRGTKYVELDGSAAGANTNGLVIRAGDSEVHGLAIKQFSGHGIVLSGKGNNVITGNRIGTRFYGATNDGNGKSGVFIDNSPNNVIGEANASSGNKIYGNGANGVEIHGTNAHDNIVQNNIIGGPFVYDTAFGNHQSGIRIDGAPRNMIGPNNKISGSGKYGVEIVGADASSNVVQGNVVGVDAQMAGESFRPNAQAGILIDNAPDNRIGGQKADQGNVIVSNGTAAVPGSGIVVRGENAVHNTIIGNEIHDHDDYGVHIVGAPNNTIGGLAAVPGKAPGNTLYQNQKAGIAIEGQRAQHNVVRGNRISALAADPANTGNGVGISVVNAPLNIIGGNEIGAGNEISGNSLSGVEIQGTDARHNVIQGNWIGVQWAADNNYTALPNAKYGIAITAAPDNTVGGVPLSNGEHPGNVIANNGLFGVDISGQTAENNVVQGNAILSNEKGGVSILSASHNLIGGGAAGAQNVIAGDLGQNQIMVRIVGEESSYNRVEGNAIGTNRDGTVGQYGGAIGVLVGGHDNVVGGANTSDGARGNVIVGQDKGIEIKGGKRNAVQGNFIGMTRNGDTYGNQTGVVLDDSATENTIGGTTPSVRNIISGNQQYGITIRSAMANVVQGNFIGTNIAGTHSVPNGKSAIWMIDASDNQIGGSEGATLGGPCSGACNLISGHGARAALVVDDSSDNRIQGNFIGPDVSGQKELESMPAETLAHGIELIGISAGNLIGGSDDIQGNLIAFNAGAGISVSTVSTNNAIIKNRIWCNGELGIDLVANGQTNAVTANDDQDADTGPNGLQNFPTITAAAADFGNVVLRGVLHSKPNTRYRIDFYGNHECDPSDYGEGQEHFGVKNVETDEYGEVRFAFAGQTFPTRLPYATATATEIAEDGTLLGTSEFSKCFRFEQDGDGDGVSDREEDENGPDMNQDGIPDRAQDFVAALPQAAVVAEQGTSLRQVATVGMVDLAHAPHGDFPIDLVQFQIHTLPAGGRTQVRIITAPGTLFNSYYKYNEIVGWYEWLYDPKTGQGAELFPDKHEIILHFGDGKLGDDDHTANGVIDDPGGPVFLSHGSIAGSVYVDVDNNGIRSPQECGLPNVPVTVKGPVTRTVVTDADGYYQFTDLPAGTYTVTESQPRAFIDGQETTTPIGAGQLEGESFVDVNLPNGDETIEYNFGERGLRPEFVSISHYLASTPPAAQLAMELINGIGFSRFQADRSGSFTAGLVGEGEYAASIQLYTSEMIPLAIAEGGAPLSVPVVEGEQYVLVVSGRGDQATLRTSIHTPLPIYATNRQNPCDVNSDGRVTPRDALLVINVLNSSGAFGGNSQLYFDVSNDGFVTPLDVLLVVNYLNTLHDDVLRAGFANAAEGEAAVDDWSLGHDDSDAAIAGAIDAEQADSGWQTWVPTGKAERHSVYFHKLGLDG